MTSLNAQSLVGDLSPEQRQALFDKLRQRKLAQARTPVDVPAPVPHSHTLPWLPTQQACPRPQANRVLEITLAQTPDLGRLADSLRQLLQFHTGLNLQTDAESGAFLPTRHNVGLPIVQARDEADFQQCRTHWLGTLGKLTPGAACIQAVALVSTHSTTTLLLASHPLLLDHYSLLGLAHQWLALYSGILTLDGLNATGLEEQNRFAHWTSQVLEHKFLNQEWVRLKPRSMATNVPRQSVTPAHATLELGGAFLEAHLPAGESRKGWLLDAVHRCLSQTLAHQDIHYWLEAPQLRADAFEAQLGFFPYYLPVTRPLNEQDAESLSAQTRLQRLQTRYVPVSEQLCLELCRNGTTAPLVHYHWFDLDEQAPNPLQVSDLQLQHPGLMLAPVEIHLIERLNSVTLNVHYQPELISADQVQYLLRALHQQLQQARDASTDAPPTLQQRLRRIWQDLLQKSDIDDEQSFFELGGHSLQVTELKFRIKQQLKLDIPISVLYELTTINKLAHFIVATHGSALGFAATAASDDDEEGTL